MRHVGSPIRVSREAMLRVVLEHLQPTLEGMREDGWDHFTTLRARENGQWVLQINIPLTVPIVDVETEAV